MLHSTKDLAAAFPMLKAMQLAALLIALTLMYLNFIAQLFMRGLLTKNSQQIDLIIYKLQSAILTP
jgi:hypothetical protein